MPTSKRTGFDSCYEVFKEDRCFNIEKQLGGEWLITEIVNEWDYERGSYLLKREALAAIDALVN